MSYCPLWSSTISPIYGGEKRGRGDKGFGDEGDVFLMSYRFAQVYRQCRYMVKGNAGCVHDERLSASDVRKKLTISMAG